MITTNQFIKRVSKYLLCLFYFLPIVSCKKGDWYDIKADKQLAVPSTLRDMQALMDNGRAMNTFTPALGEVGSDGHYVSDARALTLTGFIRNGYTWSREQPNINVTDWINGSSSGSYRRIYYANLVLDGIPPIEPNGTIEQEQWNNIKGQALFHRAHAFYELSQVFAPPYETATAANKSGIPLRLESDINIPSKRATLKQTYEQIFSDLAKAQELLPQAPLYRSRPSRQAVYGLLARMYLSMEDYEQANKYARMCLDSYSTLMDYNTLSTSGTTNPIQGYNPEIIFYSYMAPASNVLSTSNNLIDSNFYNTYHENDLRKKIFFNRNATTKLITYKGNYSGQGFSNCFSGLATDEMYLIRAECNARAGKVTEAMDDLNTLLEMRWLGTHTDITATNSEDALIKVLEERKRELFLRGLRWSDLRRLNRDPRFVVTLTRTIGTKTYTLEPNSYKYTFPIPDDIIEFTGMEQNEGWD